jgi:hypothetical protein
MDDSYYDLSLAMFALAITAVMPVAGELYLVTRPQQAETRVNVSIAFASPFRK